MVRSEGVGIFGVNIIAQKVPVVSLRTEPTENKSSASLAPLLRKKKKKKSPEETYF